MVVCVGVCLVWWCVSRCAWCGGVHAALTTGSKWTRMPRRMRRASWRRGCGRWSRRREARTELKGRESSVGCSCDSLHPPIRPFTYFHTSTHPSIHLLFIHLFPYIHPRMRPSGEYPVFRAGTHYTYISCTNIFDSAASMRGHYTVRNLFTSGCSVVWCDVVECGVVWCGVVRCGVVWCSMVGVVGG